MAPASTVWEAMDEITSPGVADQISIARCRELLGDEAAGMSDDEIDRIREHAETIAHVLIEMFLEDRSTIQ
jgi:hypothetical protein